MRLRGGGALTIEQEQQFADLYRSGATRKAWHAAFPGVSDGVFNGRITRLKLHRAPRPETVMGLRPDNPALRDGRTIFPTRVRDPSEAPLLLQPGSHSAKLGDRVEKGAWRGMPIFSLTLEERATCPRSCLHWSTCMGSGMPWAWRHRHGPELIGRLDRDLALMQRRQRGGFVVRLHLLGDFFSVAYLNHWGDWLDRFPGLRVFGYTAWSPETPIGFAVHALSQERPDRFAIRHSAAEPGPMRAVTLWEMPVKTGLKPGLIPCPAQTGRTKSCSSCALCWSPAARDKTIAFVAHGR